MTATDWPDVKNDTIVAEYLMILSEELLGRRYNKARRTAPCKIKLVGIEIPSNSKSPTLRRLAGPGLATFKRYAPRFNLEMSLVKAAARWFVRDPDGEAALRAKNNAGWPTRRSPSLVLHQILKMLRFRMSWNRCSASSGGSMPPAAANGSGRSAMPVRSGCLT